MEETIAQTYKIQSTSLNFPVSPIYGSKVDINEDSLEFLFINVSIENILTLWKGLLLDRKIILLSESKSLLTHISMALVSLIFPFEWNFVFIPVLPSKLKAFIDAPLPYLIGVYFDQIDFPPDAIVFDLKNNVFVKYYETMPKLPPKLFDKSLTALNTYKEKFNNPEDLVKVTYVDTTFAEEIFQMTDSNVPWDPLAVRKTFFRFFTVMFQNYKKYFPNLENLEEGQFNVQAFLKDHNSRDPGTFLYEFVETTIFLNFFDLKAQNAHQIALYKFFFELNSNQRS